MKTEQWKSIKGYEGLYEVSNLGRVRSLDRLVKYNGFVKKDSQIIKPATSCNGYLFVCLYNQTQKRILYLHKLVAENFIPNPYKRSVINHIDEIKSNNEYINLEWCTTSDNVLHSIKTGTSYHNGMSYGRSKVNAEQAISIRLSYESGASLSVLANQYSMTKSGISNIIKRKSWRYA